MFQTERGETQRREREENRNVVFGRSIGYVPGDRVPEPTDVINTVCLFVCLL